MHPRDDALPVHDHDGGLGVVRGPAAAFEDASREKKLFRSAVSRSIRQKNSHAIGSSMRRLL